MTKFILHGGFTRKENESNRSFFEELARDVPNSGVVLMVFFASREDDPTSTFNELSSRIRQEANSKDLRFVLATQEGFVDEVKRADAIYLHGGSTNKLLETLRTYPSLGPLMEGKTVAGSSAGAYAIAKYGTSHSEDAMREGLGLAPLRVVCHFESSELPPAPGAVALLQNTAANLELVLLKDCEWKVFNF
jgi:peptidase E